MKQLKNNLKFSWNYVKSEKQKVILYLLLGIADLIINVITPILSAKLIVDLTNSKFEQLILISLVVYMIEILRNIVRYISGYLVQRVYRETFIKIQTDLGNNILKLENKVIDANSSGLFIQRLTNDTSKLAEIFNSLIMYLINIFTDIGIFVAIFIINKIVFIYLVIMTIILFLLENKRTKLRTTKENIYRKESEKTVGFVGEIIRGLRDIKMLNSESSFINELHSKVVKANGIKYEEYEVDRKYTLLKNIISDTKELSYNNIICIFNKQKSIINSNSISYS